jgi:hypothetical protein
MNMLLEIVWSMARWFERSQMYKKFMHCWVQKNLNEPKFCHNVTFLCNLFPSPILPYPRHEVHDIDGISN